MSNGKITLCINIIQEKILFLNKLKEIIFNNEGIIYGGTVRDKIISDYYKQKFIDKKNNTEFFDLDNDKETINRLLVPDDVDMYFNNEEKYLSFLNNLKSIFSVSLLETNINDINVYLNNFNIIKKKYNISFIIGKTFTYPGISISINVDVIYTDNKGVQIEPPFKNIDFLCNVFIENKEGIRISNNTGTIIDEMNSMEKITISAKIMNDIVNFKTSLAGNYNKYLEKILVMRVCKLLNKKNINWSINNLPFIIQNNEDDENEDELCVICQLSYKKNEKIVKINKDLCLKYHCNCFMQYLQFQSTSNRNEKIRCPLRHDIDFINIDIPDYNKMKYLL